MDNPKIAAVLVRTRKMIVKTAEEELMPIAKDAAAKFRARLPKRKIEFIHAMGSFAVFIDNVASYPLTDILTQRCDYHISERYLYRFPELTDIMDVYEACDTYPFDFELGDF